MDFTWNKNWIDEFESPWGILEKFKYANNATGNDICDIFGNNERINRYSKKNRDLLTLEGFDENNFIKYLNYPVKKTLSINLKNITNIINISDSHYRKYFRDKLTFCPQCLKSGYHSIFHQFSLISYCPFHPTIKLLNKCPSCHNEVKYELDNVFKTPFTCNNCGYSFSDTFSPFKKWKSKEEANEVTSNLYRWIRFNITEPNTRIIILEEIFLNREGEIIDNILDAKNVFKQTYTLIHSNDNKKTEMNVDELFITSKKTYSSIARRYRKTILKEHISCIKRYKRNALTQEFCPYAYSYILWKQHVQGLDNHTQVDNSYKPKRWYTHFNEFASKQDHKFLESIFQKLNFLIEYTYKNKQPIIEMIMNRIMSLFVIDHFYNWLHIATNSNEHNIQGNNYQTYKNLPFFYIKISGSIIEFIYEKSEREEVISFDYKIK